MASLIRPIGLECEQYQQGETGSQSGQCLGEKEAKKWQAITLMLPVFDFVSWSLGLCLPHKNWPFLLTQLAFLLRKATFPATIALQTHLGAHHQLFVERKIKRKQRRFTGRSASKTSSRRREI